MHLFQAPRKLVYKPHQIIPRFYASHSFILVGYGKLIQEPFICGFYGELMDV